MIINDTMIQDYLKGNELEKYKEEWYFTNSTVAGSIGNNIYTEPVRNEELITKVEHISDLIKQVSTTFIPTNQKLWDVLFPEWRTILDSIGIDLIVGFPEPYDATVERDKEGVRHIIFDMLCWTKYLGKCNLQEAVQNLLTHELCHVLIGTYLPNIDDDTESKDYLINLDAITFHEAYAHLVSYQAKEIDTVDWNSEMLLEVKEKSIRRLTEALLEEDVTKQQKNLYDAICGDYYEKYACMSGMLYLANLWMMGGENALKQCFEEGYHGFAKKVGGSI